MPAVVSTPSVMSPESNDGCGSVEAEPPIGLDVDVVCETGGWKEIDAATSAICSAAAAVASELGISGKEACVALSTDQEVAELNATYRSQAAPTNVLSFPAGGRVAAQGAKDRFLGDIVLASETISREAAALGLPLAHHLQHVVVHGLLHLLGFDHRTDEEAHAMEALEVRILARLGIPNPYQAADASHST